MRKTPFMPGEYYHIYNRTILGIPEFKETNNCNRLTQAFLLSNSTKSTTAFQFLRNHKDATLDEALEIARGGEKLVDVLCYAIMPDHYHLLIREVKEKGIAADKYSFKKAKNLVQGPKYKDDFENKETYEKYQYVIINVK